MISTSFFSFLLVTAIQNVMGVPAESNSSNFRTWAEAKAMARRDLAKLTLHEKAIIASGSLWEKGVCLGNIAPVPSIKFPGLCLEDSATGVRLANNVSSFSSAINVAATFDRKLMLQQGAFVGKEYYGKGVNFANAVIVNFMRSPAGGRGWEGAGGDPYLQSVVASSSIRGIQSHGVIATVKHFIGYEQEHHRGNYSSNIDDRTLHEVYLRPFAAAVEAGVGAVMCATNQVNNVYACENPHLIQEILKGELGFEGLVMTNWYASQTAEGTANAGVDMMLPGNKNGSSKEPMWGINLERVVNDSLVNVSRVDDMVTRVLGTWYRFGQDIDYPKLTIHAFNKTKNLKIDVTEHHYRHIYAVGAASSILLKNTDNALPIKGLKTIAVIGSDAGPGNSTNQAESCPDHSCVDGTIAQGWGSGTTNFPYIVTPLEGIKKRANGEVNVSSFLNDWDLKKAAQKAKNADMAIVFVSADSGESYLQVEDNIGDRNNLSLWRNGDKLIEAVANVNNNTVVVIHGPGAVDMPWVDNPGVVAIIHALFPGQESGNAIADVLFGDVNPSGRLPFTINSNRTEYAADVLYSGKSPKGYEYPQINYTEGLLVDYRWNDAKDIDPLFPFGFGLSYTTFNYSSFNIKNGSVTFKITNTGERDGHEVPQLYLGLPKMPGEPVKQLKNFDRFFIKAGASKTVKFDIVSDDLKIWDTERQKWVIPSGTFKVFIGASSRDIKWSDTFEME